MDPDSHLPRACIARAKAINPKAQQQAELNYKLKIKQEVDIYFNTLKPVSDRYERESNCVASNRSWTIVEPGLLLSYFNEMEELEKKLDGILFHKAKHARAIYRTSILNILQQPHAGRALTPLDLHPVYCGCWVIQRDL